MRRTAVVATAACGLLGAAAGVASAASSASGAAVGSPGAVSGNAVQVPVSVPVNACGNTVTGIGALNPTFANACANHDAPGATAKGVAAHSPGFISGNLVQAPVDVPVNVVGNTATVIGGLNPTLGNTGVNGGKTRTTPPKECPSLDEQGVATRALHC
ncbi:hypothetical protein BIV57_14380 [Mangrovactinospora gilvigrisea]|uniref:Chaplin domain-containing protein n=2 Tax=Mangrovactinospora gilvigrisea TaxID=1428644 RepID=A0A1J7BTK5_9ACTN|nr:hypothetical protein BIV57_14380 [Mangrovactinospora gilvigrisea]